MLTIFWSQMKLMRLVPFYQLCIRLLLLTLQEYKIRKVVAAGGPYVARTKWVQWWGRLFALSAFTFYWPVKYSTLLNSYAWVLLYFMSWAFFLCYIYWRMCTLPFYLVQYIFEDIKLIQDVAIFAGDLLFLLGISKSAASFSYNTGKNTI